MEYLEQNAAVRGRARATPIDILTARAMQLRALLAATTISHQTHALPDEHMGNVLWLAADMLDDIVEAAEDLI